MDITRRDLLISSSSVVAGATGGYAFSSLSRRNTIQESSLRSENRPYIGPLEGSRTTIFYWLDFECSFCQRFSEQTLPEVIDKLVERDNVSFIFKPLGGLEPTSLPAAISAHCVSENGVENEEFVSWKKDMMKSFSESDGDRSSRIRETKEISSEYGVNPSKIQSCIEEELYTDRIEYDEEEGNRWGFSGTPFFVIYDTQTGKSKSATGARSYSTLESFVSEVQDPNP